MALMWRPGKASRGILVLVAFISVLGYILVEGLPQKTRRPFYSEKIRAAKLMTQGMEVIKQARISIFGRINPEQDPSGSGMIGEPLTNITSKTGSLPAKQASTNPNFSAYLVDLYKRAGLKEGDVVAMAFSGSFPSLNLAALVAAEVLKLKPVPITSTAASQFGANDAELTWLDMERLLFEKGIIHHRSVAASLGGQEDRGKGISPDGVRVLRDAIKRNGMELIDLPNLSSSFELRMKIYQEAAEGKRIACYVNVGGGVGSVGNVVVKHSFASGLNKTTPHPARLGDSVMSRMSRQGIPVIHLINIEKLSKSEGLLSSGKYWEARIYAAHGYNMWIVWGVLIGLAGSIFVLLRMDFHHYLLRFRKMAPQKKDEDPSSPVAK